MQRGQQDAGKNAAEIELVASAPVYEALLQFQEATGGLLGVFIRESERLIAAGGSPSSEALAGAQAALSEELRQRRLREIYDNLLSKMRSELFDLTLDEPLRPSTMDQDDLREEVRKVAAELETDGGPTPQKS